MMLRTIDWSPDAQPALLPGHIVMIDQTRLPESLSYLRTRKITEVWTAIRTLQVRGAPAIGIAAAMGLVAAIQDNPDSTQEIEASLIAAADYLATSRPTAVNLFWALNRMKALAHASLLLTPREFKLRLAAEAVAIRNEDAQMCRDIGRHGATLLKDGDTILTHCNAGSLATAEYGTALAPVYVAHESGRRIHVFADETRPLFQGARLTAWELARAGIDVTLICDNMAAHIMKTCPINAVLVGADRIAANGDTANKIGTYGLALLARAHDVPFYVLAPSSTFDIALPSGDRIPIEERPSSEITMGVGKSIAPPGIKTRSPAFDVTPHPLISAIICEHGIIRPPFGATLRRLGKQGD
jgi:methylthioribose-1-phosphate isomerase